MKLGILGLGNMGWNHARACHELGFLAAAADPAPAARERASRLGVPLYATPEELLADPNVDGVVVAAASQLHADLALAALAKGKHVFVEKPLATNVEDGMRMVATAEAQGLTLAVGHIERHNAAVRLAQDQLARGALGTLVSLSGRRLSSLPTRIQDVGCIMDIGIHEIDILCALTGGTPRVVYARAGRRRHALHEDYAHILLDFDRGVQASIEVNWFSPLRQRRLAITGTDAVLELDYLQQQATLSHAGPSNVPADTAAPLDVEQRTFILRRDDTLQRELVDFVQAARERRRPVVDGRDGLRALAVALGALESARTGRPVPVASEVLHIPPGVPS